MKHSKPLVDLDELKKLMSGLELDKDQTMNAYINARWLNYVEWWDSRSTNAKRNYHALRGTVVIAGALIPALVGLRELKVLGDAGWIFAVLSIIASLLVAICAGMESLFNYGNIWREKRAAAELIKSEGFSFLQLIGDYEEFQSHQQALKKFTENVEQLIRSEIKDYVVAVTPKEKKDQ